MLLRSAPEASSGLQRRFVVISVVAAGIFGLLLLRLWQLQIVNDDRYRNLSDRNRTRFIHIDAPRGTMYDRNGIMLVDSRPAFSVSVMRQEVADRQALFIRLSELLGVDQRQLEANWRAGQALPGYQPVMLLEDIDRATMEIVQEHGTELPGIIVEGKPLRAYPNGPLAPHLLGYLGEIAQEDLRRASYADYRSGSLVGKIGLERLYEDQLRGQDGYRLIEVNVRGREQRQIMTRQPVPGQRLILTLDAKVQAAAEKAFGEEAGAAVVLDVRSGEILALASQPAFDPAQFARGISSDEWKALVEDARHPMQNKALRGQYPPGSTFKVAVALAALESGVATAETTVNCSGSITLGSHEFRCWNKSGHGNVNLRRALQESCDVWFYRVGMQMGIDRLATMAHKLGLGQPLGFPFGAERGGLIPDREWKKKRFGSKWYDGETAICAIGQGYVLATPLQLASLAAAVANGGTVWRPQVLKRIESLHGESLWTVTPQKVIEENWSAASLRAVRSGMEAVVNDPGGTAFRSRLKGVVYAGKTGTSQVVGRRGDKAADTSRRESRDHALFIAYAPAAAPEIAVAVVVEHGGHGGSAAAPIAKAIFEAYFGIEPEPPPAAVVPADTATSLPAEEFVEGDEQSLPSEPESDTAPLPETMQVPAVPTIDDDAVDPASAPSIRAVNVPAEP